MIDKRVRWGLLSTARINERLIPCFQQSARNELIAVASRSQAVADRYAEQHEIPRAYGSYEAMLKDSAIDAIYLSLPNALHVEWGVRCAEAGKHVLCEKPLALSVEEVDQLAEAAKRHKVIIQEATMMRFHPQTTYIRDLVAQGTIGQVRMARGLFAFTLERPRDIRLDSALGGGSVWDLGSYCVSFSRTVLQAEPVEVFGTQTEGDAGVDLSFSGHLLFSTGAFFHFYSSFAAFTQIEADILGTEGRVVLDMPWVNRVNQSATVQVIRKDGTNNQSTFSDDLNNQKIEKQIYENVNAYQDEVESMASSLLDGTPPVISLSDSRANIAVVTALYRSAREGQIVKM